MISTEVKRTLVKSPPELWAELSDPSRLERHLGEFGQIRITRSEDERLIEWESELASGRVQMKQSGWGTQVMLSVTRELRSSAAAEPEPEPRRSPPPTPEREPAYEPAPEPQVAVEREELPHIAEREDEPETEPRSGEPAPPPFAELEPPPAVEIAPEPKLGFFARMFRRRKAAAVTLASETSCETITAPEPEPVAEPGPILEPDPAPQLEELALPEPVYPDPPTEPEAPFEITAELADVEAQMERETTELLTEILDRLGAAHHRPFSRG